MKIEMIRSLYEINITNVSYRLPWTDDFESDRYVDQRTNNDTVIDGEWCKYSGAILTK